MQLKVQTWCCMWPCRSSRLTPCACFITNLGKSPSVAEEHHSHESRIAWKSASTHFTLYSTGTRLRLPESISTSGAFRFSRDLKDCSTHLDALATSLWDANLLHMQPSLILCMCTYTWIACYICTYMYRMHVVHSVFLPACHALPEVGPAADPWLGHPGADPHSQSLL